MYTYLKVLNNLRKTSGFNRFSFFNYMKKGRRSVENARGKYSNKNDSYSNSSYSAIKTKRENNSDSGFERRDRYYNKSSDKNDKSLVNLNYNNNIRTIIDNPDEAVKLSEDDIHSALLKTGKLPELDLKEIIANKDPNDSDLQLVKEEIEYKILPKLNLCLNKSLVEICKVGRNTPHIFKTYENFWISLQEEILLRVDSLSNEQIVDIASSFAKCAITPKITLFEELEESITDSPILFLISQTEKIFFSFCAQKKGSTAFLKYMTGKIFRQKDLFSSACLAKLISALNSHPQTIKGNFGHVKELEEQITKEIENKRIKFVDLIKLAEYLFTDNIGSNDIHRLIENALVEKFENRIEIEMSQVIKLVKSLSDYFIKNEDLCLKIKNYVELYLNGYIGREKEILSEAETKDLELNENNDEQIDNTDRPYKNIDITFAAQYTKLVTNINTLIWSFSKNKTFLNLKENPECNYFYKRLKETFLKNIDYYNGREIVFCLEGISKLQPVFTTGENEIITNKLKNLDFNTTHDIVKLLKILVTNENLLNDITTFDSLVKNVSSDYDKLSYRDRIDFTDIIYNFPLNSDQIYTLDYIQNFEKKLSPILLQMDIIYLCKLVNILSKTGKLRLDNDFVEIILKTLKIRINEIPKEQFCEVLTSAAKLKSSELVLNLIEILEDLSNFEDIKSCFNKPFEYLNLLWSLLSIYHRQNWSLKLNGVHFNFIENTIKKYLPIENEPIELFLSVFLTKEFDINFYLDSNLHNREENYSKYLQTAYLSYLYLVERLSLDKTQSKKLLDKVNEILFQVSFKFNLNCRSNFISLDPASKCDKEIVQDLQNNIVLFFSPKQNTTIYPNFIDEFLNPVNILVNFELPKLKPDEEVTGIDSKIFAVILLNDYYYSNNKEITTTFDNRIRILKDVLNFEVKEIKEEDWRKLNQNQKEKQRFLSEMFGFNFDNNENVQTKIIKKSSTNISSTGSVLVTGKKTKTPKFNLTKQIISK